MSIAMTNPKINIVSGSTMNRIAIPWASGFSAIRPMPALPIADCAIPVPIAPPLIAIAPAIAATATSIPSAKNSPLFFSITPVELVGLELHPASNVELGEELDEAEPCPLDDALEYAEQHVQRMKHD